MPTQRKKTALMSELKNGLSRWTTKLSSPSHRSPYSDAYSGRDVGSSYRPVTTEDYSTADPGMTIPRQPPSTYDRATRSILFPDGHSTHAQQVREIADQERELSMYAQIKADEKYARTLQQAESTWRWPSQGM